MCVCVCVCVFSSLSEVIMKNPQEFKIAALKDIGFLFCRKLTDGPYYAGFGNRMSVSPGALCQR